MNKTLIICSVLFVSILLMAFIPQQEGKDSTKTQTTNKVKVTAAKKTKVAQLSYKTDIAPLFKKYCLPCHTEDMMNPSELYLDSYDNIMVGGKHGKILVAGKPDSSNIIKKLSGKPPFGDPMPLKRKTPFPADTLKMFRAWIEQGAKNN